METVNYEVDGEASDWILGTFGIIAASPELGIETYDADRFFPSDIETAFKVLEANYPWVKYSIKKLGVQIGISGIESGFDGYKKDKVFNMTFEIQNKGLKDA